MGTPLPKSVHAKYRNLTTSDFAKLVMQVVKKPGASPDQQLIEWIVALAVRDLRQVFVTETMRDDLQAQKWLVFSIRYLKPLLLKDHKAATRKQVLKDIDNASDPERTAILWGDYEQYCAALKGELDKNTSALRKLSQLQENLLRAIPYMLNYEETVVNERCEQPLIHLEALVQENSPDAFSQVRSMMLNSIIPLRTTQRTALAAFRPFQEKKSAEGTMKRWRGG